MALVVADRVQEVTSTAGTGTLDLSGAVGGYQSFVSGVGSGNTTYYVVYDQTAQLWEIGLGTVTSGSPDTLSRDTVLLNSSGGTSKINFPGNAANVWCDYPALKSVYRAADGSVTLPGSLSVTGSTTLATSISGILKATSGTVSAATSGTDYAPATSGTSILKGNGAGGFSDATSGTDYAPATSGTAILKGNGAGGFSSTTAGVDYSAGTSALSSGILKSTTSTGALSIATAGTDYVAPGGALGTPSSGVLTNCTSLPLSTGISGTLAIANGGTNQTAFTGLSGNTAGLVFFDGTKLTNDATVTHAGYDTVSHTMYVNNFNASGTATLASGAVLNTPASGTLSNCTVDGTDAVGFRNIPQNAQTGSYTLVAADSGKHIYHAVGAGAATYTIPANGSVAYAIGTALTFVNLSSTSISIAITTDTMYLAGSGSTGTRTLAQYGSATALKITSTSWIISGAGVS
jgi:hypothetical protein